MIYGKIWLVVKPSVGVPRLLGAVDDRDERLGDAGIELSATV